MNITRIYSLYALKRTFRSGKVGVRMKMIPDIFISTSPVYVVVNGNVSYLWKPLLPTQGPLAIQFDMMRAANLFSPVAVSFHFQQLLYCAMCTIGVIYRYCEYFSYANIQTRLVMKKMLRWCITYIQCR